MKKCNKKIYIFQDSIDINLIFIFFIFQASELPTVLEQVSDDESIPLTTPSPTEIHTPIKNTHAHSSDALTVFTSFDIPPPPPITPESPEDLDCLFWPKVISCYYFVHLGLPYLCSLCLCLKINSAVFQDLFYVLLKY